MSESEFLGLSSSDEDSRSSTPHAATPEPAKGIDKAVEALLESSRLMQQVLTQSAATKKQRIYVAMPERFNGKVGDYIHAWLEQFETWFRHREQVEGAVLERTRIETAMQNTKSDISLDLTHHEEDFGQWATWDAFALHMKEAYGSSESGYDRFIQLRVMGQGKDSVDKYYARFRRMLGKQKKRMKNPEDNHIYYMMFVAGLDGEVNREVLRRPEAIRIEDMQFHEVLELAKRAEQTVKSQKRREDPDHGNTGRKPRTSNAGVSKVRKDVGGSPIRKAKSGPREKLTPREKEFLKNNIKRGGGLVVYENVRNKSEWISWARKEGVCIKCCAKGHRSAECTAGLNDANVSGATKAKLNAMETKGQGDQGDIDSDAMETDCEYLCSIQDRKRDALMTYHCMVNGRRGIVLLDTGATKNYVSRRFAEKANLKFKDKGIAQRSVKLPNGRFMNVLGECEFLLGMSEWTGMVKATVLDLDADFDTILGMQWHRQWKPVYDWDTLDVFVNSPEGAQRIVHTYGSGVEGWLNPTPSLTTLSEWPKGWDTEVISVHDAEREVKGGAKAYLYFVRAAEHGLGDSVDLTPSTASESERESSERTGSSRLNLIPDRNGDFSVETGKVSSLRKLLRKYKDVFRTELPDGLPPRRAVDHAIETGDANPINKNAYPLSVQQLQEQARQVDELLQRGLIRESVSPWGAPVLFVPKKNGEWRMCIDYRMLNSKTLKNAYPLPRIQECIDRLSKAKHLSSIDLLSGYWQLRVAEMDIPKTAFNTRYGKYEFLVMPFGLTNAPATFQTLMNSILRPFIDKFVLVYLDDILVYSDSEEEHLKHLEMVFEALRQHSLYARPEKCVFDQPTVEFCGHLVGQGVVKVLDSKVKVIKEWPQPKNVQEVRQFYGLVNYYRRFIRHFSIIAAPLSDLFKSYEGDKRKKRPIAWSMQHQLAFDRLKQAVMTAPVLVQPDPSKPYTIETDSSDFGNGMALHQCDEDGKLHPVAFDGRKLHGAEIRYPTHEKELLAIKDALLKWHHYVENGLPITVITDHDSLKYMNTVQKPSKRLARWIDEFQQYNLVIKYRPGSQAVVPDAISRRPDFYTSDGTLLNALSARMRNDYIPYVREFLETGRISEEANETARSLVIAEVANFMMEDGVLHRKVKEGMRVPFVEFEFRGDLMQKMHDQYGHLSYQGLANVLESRAWWPTMERDVREFIAACPNCQTQQRQRVTQEREPNELLTNPFIQPFQRWGIDLIGRLPNTMNGNRWIITAIDYATGWPIAKAIPVASEEAIADFIFTEIYMHYGAPQEIFTDGGKNLWGGVVQRYLAKIKTLHKGTSPYHPRTNGKVERLNGIVGAMLGKMLLNKPTKLWDLYLDQALFACRIRTHTTTKTSPFYLLYGQHPHLLGDYNATLPQDAESRVPEERLKLVQSARMEAAMATHERALKDKTTRDQLVKPHKLREGDWVLVRHENPQKFEAKWFGPYQVVQRMLLGTYRLQDPNGRELAALVHGNRLIQANIRTAEELRELWASPKAKDQLRKRNRHVELIPSYPENTDALDQYLQDEQNEDPTDEVSIPELEPKHIMITRKRTRDLQADDEIAKPPRLPKRKRGQPD
jgi:hypothetical protein